MKIKTIEELKDFFRYNDNLMGARILVSTKIRREWLLNHERTIIRGTVYNIKFSDMKGGVWIAEIVK